MVDLLEFPRVLNVVTKMVTGYMGKELLIFVSSNDISEVQKANIYIDNGCLIIEDLYEDQFKYCINLYDIKDCSIELGEFDIDSFINMGNELIHINSFK